MVDRFKGTILVTDLETTGINVAEDSLCQLAALAMTQRSDMSWVCTPLLQTYCAPSSPMSKEAVAVHGITPDKYKYAPNDMTAIWVLRCIMAGLNDPVILSGYNCTRYDYPMMCNVYSDHLFNEMPQIDVMTLFLRLAPEHGLKLTEVYMRLFGEDDLLTSAHDALADITMTARLLEWYFRMYPTDPEVLAQWCATPAQLEVMPWGKHKGKAFSTVPKSYLQWMSAKWTDMHPDLALSLRNGGFLK